MESPLFLISPVFRIQRHSVIFRMPHNKDLTPVQLSYRGKTPASSDSASTISSFAVTNVLRWTPLYGGNAVQGKDHQTLCTSGIFRFGHPMPEKAEHFFLQHPFFQSVSDGKAPPVLPSTDAKWTSHASLLQSMISTSLIPVIHFFKLHLSPPELR